MESLWWITGVRSWCVFRMVPFYLTVVTVTSTPWKKWDSNLTLETSALHCVYFDQADKKVWRSRTSWTHLCRIEYTHRMLGQIPVMHYLCMLFISACWKDDYEHGRKTSRSGKHVVHPSSLTLHFSAFKQLLSSAAGKQTSRPVMSRGTVSVASP